MKVGPRSSPKAYHSIAVLLYVVVFPYVGLKQSGFMFQIAITAARRAVISALGHTLGHAISVGFRCENNVKPAVTYQEPQGIHPLATVIQPLPLEMKQFLKCSQDQSAGRI
ncbi:coiled-coil-helix-coiled-coil-helix domain-containing protein 2-like [Dromiciops gliroides]|uniref:coiled-coil-helix-coiled-coil-helix domain-containing protein 2-like n=1 Tax=Dromiciops gliroides TaxID=33562 RepID=UPI001CC5070A|nr:coiled-coil-helix-coiled-coil-helix domain-containing protein 2-like [Dromiciops gliroides]